VLKQAALLRNAPLVRNLLKKQQHLTQTDAQIAEQDFGLEQVKKLHVKHSLVLQVNNLPKLLLLRLPMVVQTVGLVSGQAQDQRLFVQIKSAPLVNTRL
jgi:hypothetical protein